MGTVRYCRLWVPNFVKIAKPLYKGLGGTPEFGRQRKGGILKDLGNLEVNPTAQAT